MPSIESYEYHENPAYRTLSLIVEDRVTVAVSSRNGSLQATVSTQDLPDPPASSAADLASISRLLFWHINGLLQVILALCVMSFTTAVTPIVRVCRSLKELFFQWFDSTLENVPHPARLLGTFLKSQVRSRWPCLQRVVYRTIVSPAKLVQAITDFQAPIFGLPDPNVMRGSTVSLHDHINDSVAIRLIKRPSIPSADYHSTQSRRRTSQTPAPTVRDDLHIFDERSVSSYVSDGLREKSSRSERSRNTLDRCQGETTPPEQQVKFSDQCHTNESHAARLDLCEIGAGTPKDAEKSSPNPLQPPRQFSENPSRLLDNFDETTLDHRQEVSGTQNCNSVLADGEVSPISSDFAHAESFSPEQLHFPHTNETKRPTESAIFSTLSSQEGHQGGQLLQTLPLTPAIPEPHDNQTTASPDTHPASVTRYTPPPDLKSSEHQQTTERFQDKFSSLHLACDGAFIQNDDTDYYASETTSCCGEPYARTARTSGHQQPEADACDETCFSCETCDRRHKRARRSRIPRTVKTFEHYRPRSSSFTSCYSARTAGSASTVGRKRLQKRKANVD
jgi:hypothetical protein